MVVVCLLMVLVLLVGCSHGEATKILPAYNEKQCYDSDNGINLTVQGTARGPSASKAFISKTDSCASNTSLFEYYCNRNKVTSVTKSCDSLGSNYFCSNSRCCKIIRDPGIYVLEDCDLVEGYYGKYFLKYDFKDGNVLRFKTFSHPDERGYLDMGGAAWLVTVPPGSDYGKALRSYSFNIQFVNFTSDGKPIIRKYASCNDTFSIQQKYPGVGDCVYDPNPNFNFTKYFFDNLSVGVVSNEYNSPLALAECAAKGVFNDVWWVYNVTGIKSPFERVVAARDTLESGWAGAYHPGTNLILIYLSNHTTMQGFTNDCLQNLANNSFSNLTLGFFPHETTHLVTNGFFTDYDDKYCAFFTEGLALFTENKIRLDSNDYNPLIFDAQHPPNLNKFLGCGPKGYDFGYIINGTQTYNYNYTNYSLGCKPASWDNYANGACFWYFLYQDYGDAKFKQVLQELDKRRFVKNPNDVRVKYDLFQDVLVPILGPGIVSSTKEKWGFPG